MHQDIERFGDRDLLVTVRDGACVGAHLEGGRLSSRNDTTHPDGARVVDQNIVGLLHLDDRRRGFRRRIVTSLEVCRQIHPHRCLGVGRCVDVGGLLVDDLDRLSVSLSTRLPLDDGVVGSRALSEEVVVDRQRAVALGNCTRTEDTDTGENVARVLPPVRVAVVVFDLVIPELNDGGLLVATVAPRVNAVIVHLAPTNRDVGVGRLTRTVSGDLGNLEQHRRTMDDVVPTADVAVEGETGVWEVFAVRQLEADRRHLHVAVIEVLDLLLRHSRLLELLERGPLQDEGSRLEVLDLAFGRVLVDRWAFPGVFQHPVCRRLVDWGQNSLTMVVDR